MRSLREAFLRVRLNLKAEKCEFHKEDVKYFRAENGRNRGQGRFRQEIGHPKLGSITELFRCLIVSWVCQLLLTLYKQFIQDRTPVNCTKQEGRQVKVVVALPAGVRNILGSGWNNLSPGILRLDMEGGGKNRRLKLGFGRHTIAAVRW